MDEAAAMISGEWSADRLALELEDARAAVAELIEAVKTQRAIAAESGPWLQPDVRPAFALLVGLDRFATRAEITKRADENVAAALARVGGSS
jgi:hypothetical protein